MSDTASPPSKKDTLRRIAAGALVVLGVVLVLGGAYFLYARQAVRAGAPFPFKPFKFRIAEEMIVRGKYTFLDAPGAPEPVELVLDERELNAVLFGAAKHEARGEKAQVRIEGDALRLQYSLPSGDGEAWLNLSALLRPRLAKPKGRRPLGFVLVLEDGAVGDYTLGPFTRPLVEERLNERFRAQCAADPRLRKISTLSITDGRVTFRYEGHP